MTSERRTKTPPRGASPWMRWSRQAGAGQRLERGLQILDVRGRAFVEDHEVDCQLLQPPVLERAQQLADDAEIVRVVDPHQYDRQFARNALRPEQRKSSVAAPERIRGRPQGRITVDHVTGKALEQHRFVPGDAQVVELHLSLCPRKRGGALIRRRIAVLVRQVEHLATRWCGQGPERHARRGAGREPHAAAEAEDRVEHGSVGARKRATVRDCDGRAKLPAAPNETCTVRLELQFTIHVAFDDGEMCRPGLGLLRRAAPPRREDDADFGDVFRLHEELGKRRVRVIGDRRRQHDLGVGRQLEGPDTTAHVGDAYPANLRVVLGRDDDVQRRRYVAVTADELRASFAERDLVIVRLDTARLVTGRPGLAAVHVTHETYEPQVSQVTSGRQRVIARSPQRLYPEPAAVSITE